MFFCVKFHELSNGTFSVAIVMWGNKFPPAQRTFWLFSHACVRALFSKIDISHGNQSTIHVFCVEFEELSSADFIY